MKFKLLILAIVLLALLVACAPEQPVIRLQAVPQEGTLESPTFSDYPGGGVIPCVTTLTQAGTEVNYHIDCEEPTDMVYYVEDKGRDGFEVAVTGSIIVVNSIIIPVGDEVCLYLLSNGLHREVCLTVR